MDNEKNISSSDLSKNSGGNALAVDDFQKAFGENFSDAIDINTWSIGANLAELYPLIESEWLQAKTDENKNQKIFRDTVFPRIKEVVMFLLPACTMMLMILSSCLTKCTEDFYSMVLLLPVGAYM